MVVNSFEPNEKLRLAPPESREDLVRRVERERRATLRCREDRLTQTLAPYRVGSVPHLNAVPLTRGIEEDVLFLPPAELAVRLQQGELDAALISVTEVLLRDAYDVLEGVAVASLGEVKSVFLAHRRPLSEVRQVYCDPVSLASRVLLEVLLAEMDLRPEFCPLAADAGRAGTPWPDYVMLIGDRALEFLFAGHEHEIWDLGAAWYERTQLPFVYAVWALRRGIDRRELTRRLIEAKDFGLDTLDSIIASRTDFTPDFRKDYLGWHIHYHLGSDEKRGITRFVELLRRHGRGPVWEPRYVV